MPPRTLPIAVLISGGGRTLRNLLEQIYNQQLGADVRLVISSTSQAGGLAIAREAEIPIRVIERRTAGTAEQYSVAIFDLCREAGCELVVMGGFLKHVQIPPDFENRVINIHPGLIPAFCGRGFYGHHVHEAVLAYGAKLSGCTVHFADNQYDHGPIILQRAVPVEETDTPDSLAARVFAEECRALPDAIRLFAQGRLRVEGRLCRVLPASLPE